MWRIRPVQDRLHNPHFGEEPCLSGTNGSGTIFFGCSCGCLFCQNFLSHGHQGDLVTQDEPLYRVIQLCKKGPQPHCHATIGDYTSGSSATKSEKRTSISHSYGILQATRAWNNFGNKRN